MPLQNRMNPMGQLHGVKARGLLMGNRGQLHNAAREIVRPWKLNRWITCALEYQGIKRELMASNSYTELFFLDDPRERPPVQSQWDGLERLLSA